MWTAIVIAVVVVVVAFFYRRSVAKLRRQGHELRGMGDYTRHKREVRRDVEAWNAQEMMGQPPPRRTIGEDRGEEFRD
jgi:flagellar biosynthesis/type III secretory pathway M-ring protein FliF/YscJ